MEVRLQGFDRRFWVFSQPSGWIRFCVLAIVLVGLFFWTWWVNTDLLANANSIFLGGLGLFSIAFAGISLLWWIGQRPKVVPLLVESNRLHIGSRSVEYTMIESWCLIDLPERALLIIRLLGGQGKTYVELYIDKEVLAESGLVNVLTQRATFNPELDSGNVLYTILRLVGLY
jgi:hypothetical protein